MIHVFNESDGNWDVWTDPDDEGGKIGRCIGTGATKVEALDDSRIELLADLEQVRGLLKECESQSLKKP